jgi:hypothetical protein
MPATEPQFSVEGKTMSENERESVAAPAYETPAIEEVIPAEEMEREVHYAGDGSQVTG